MRGGKRQDLTVTIGDMKEATKILAGSANERLGGQFRSLTEKEAAGLGLDSPKGVVITKVEPKGPLAQAGFEAGDIILAVNGQAVGDLDSFGQLIAVLPSGAEATMLAADPKKGVAGTVKVKTR
ncbi:MAG: putative periplasmic serine endoprotease DegP-like precursor [Syntrophorhabdaceae bacterium PtaU1.Bin034]|nr:MAG: putative periplasmic serine endoprotease DegP-like precursor [Syntrophorhabdaceae bacterium PtaU1.Bin034]